MVKEFMVSGKAAGEYVLIIEPFESTSIQQNVCDECTSNHIILKFCPKGYCQVQSKLKL